MPGIGFEACTEYGNLLTEGRLAPRDVEECEVRGGRVIDVELDAV